jgi:hypothetical protein
MAALFHDGFYVRRMRGAGAVDFNPDFHPGIRGGFAAFAEHLVDLLQSFFDRDFLGLVVWFNSPPASADVGGQLNEFFARLDILADNGGIRGMKLADAAAAPTLHSGVGESLPDFLALAFVQAWFDAVLMGGAQLDRR